MLSAGLQPNRARRRWAPARRSNGFTLIEVLVALLVISVGLLGLAKMDALAISNTQVSSGRSLIALQASSMAAAMQGNKGYWAKGLAPAAFSAAGTAVTDNLTGTLNQTVDPACTSGRAPVCTPGQLAAYDMQTWAAGMAAQFPSYAANFTCSNIAGAPPSCNIEITWSEKYVALNRTTTTGSAADGGAQTATQSYFLYVQP